MNLKIKNFSKINGTVKAPSSKSYSHRAVILASLSEGKSKLFDVLYSEDVLSTIRACEALGARIDKKKEIILKGDKSQTVDYLEVYGTGGKLHNVSDDPSSDMIDLANSGTTLRIMTSVAALSDNEVIFTGDDSLKTRPMGALIDALETLGVKIESLNENNKAPLKIYPGYEGGQTDILGSISSQFISSILISAPLSENGVELEVYPEFVSKPYVDMTISILEKFGISVEEEEYQFHETCKKEHTDCLGVKFIVKPQKYIASDYIVEGDFSSASYLLAATAIAGGYIRVQNLFADSKQGDKLILDILEEMGANVTVFDDYVSLRSDGNLKGIDVNLSNAPDLLLTVAVLGALAEGKTTISGVKHGRLKETDRIDTTCRELEKLGCKLEEFEDGMTIYGNTISDGIVESHGDHRLAMAFSLIGLKHDVEVENGECFDVSFPNFIEAMAEIGIDLELK
ncbi:3-phosphoshikimate 1-carboxyvinyltransferase AroA [Methanobrevibacter ruminantium M1]|uniref:3-phosphoshikimate 1-carboxyvinyltransferase n=1 Tax=Methanobrevibacter ruminantium (strain ATCC 35063 / DSM 1093 / JCM 13430 / OCM 146 / M1) TaxID=634498 RepID=D3E4N3_METRM|nr:3-phosphoshikimate 1-carboxyvinyltransferase [Methanobrevibacter ruminantium]ADC47427.1 3-phosphoshikimate 1-carboxyvinyltransferase AroA [Methanobrevibacter ruminantium M1]